MNTRDKDKTDLRVKGKGKEGVEGRQERQQLTRVSGSSTGWPVLKQGLDSVDILDCRSGISSRNNSDLDILRAHAVDVELLD